MNKHIEISLKTWYPKDHALHLDPIHPAMGLAGEVGEWINKHKKDKFKTGYKFSREDQLDELGDIWYYLRILMHQFNMNKEPSYPPTNYSINLIADLSLNASDILFNVAKDCYNANPKVEASLYHMVKTLKGVLFKLEVTLDELTALNWEKLKPGSTRGDEWTKSW